MFVSCLCPLGYILVIGDLQSEMFVRELLEATKGSLIKGNPNTPFSGISIDSRTIKKGELFIALKGKNFDGYDFIGEAIKKGAAGVLQARGSRLQANGRRQATGKPFVIQVADTTRALGDIAAYQRRRFDIPLVAVTGSNGKSTVKELIAFLLSFKYKVLKSEKNWNNCIGLSLSLLKLTPQHQVAVVEMGTNHFGELRRLGEIGQPTIGVITNIGKAHLEFFKDIEGVYRAKMELLESLSPQGTIVIDGGDKKLCSLVREKFRGEILRFDPGSLGSASLAAAFTVCKRLGMSEKEMAEKIKHFRNLPMRMEISEIKGVRIINDAYNSNPSSLAYAIERLAQFKGRKILVVGDMLELGEESDGLHFEMGRLIVRAKIDILVTVGKLAEKIAKGARHFNPSERFAIQEFGANSQATGYLLKIIQKGDTILVKGSRRMRMEEVVEGIIQGMTN